MARTLSESARRKMLDAATEVVLEAGVGGFNVDEIARRSGVAKTTIYRHFPDSKTLLVAALDQALVAPPIPDEGSLRDDLVAYMISVRPLFADLQLRTLFFEIYAAATRDPELAEMYQSLMAERSGPTRAIYDNARARGELSPDFSYQDMLETVRGPLIARAMTRPETLTDRALRDMVDRILPVLTP